MTHKYPILINSDSYIGNSTFRYTFPLGAVSLRRAKLALQSIQIYYSWFNIGPSYNNQIFTLAFPQNAGYTYLRVLIPAGYYTVATLNEFLQNFMIQNDLYLIDDNGNYVYYFELLQNPSYYSIQINLFEVPTSLPAGYTAPTGWIFPSVAGRLPFVTIGADNNFGDLIGFKPDTYAEPSQLSNKTPQMSTVQAVIVQCPILRNVLSNPSTNLYTFSQGSTTFGDLIISNAYELVYCDVIDCTITYLDIILVDQHFNLLPINDTNLTIQLILKIED
jgi:hypothetical protein